MIDLIEFLVRPLLSKPEKLKVDCVTQDAGSTYTISVDPEDVGMVIGKSGKVIRAIRQAAKVRAMYDHEYVTVHLDAPPAHTSAD